MVGRAYHAVHHTLSHTRRACERPIRIGCVCCWKIQPTVKSSSNSGKGACFLIGHLTDISGPAGTCRHFAPAWPPRRWPLWWRTLPVRLDVRANQLAAGRAQLIRCRCVSAVQSGLPEPACKRDPMYMDLYQNVVHGLQDCNYMLGCPPACRRKHLRLREHTCFIEYIRFRPYLCSLFAKIGEICDSDLASHCDAPGPSIGRYWRLVAVHYWRSVHG
eukprot:COSAG01_NODE_174_length_23022_cov_528.590978_18_plen_217_part_00